MEGDGGGEDGSPGEKESAPPGQQPPGDGDEPPMQEFEPDDKDPLNETQVCTTARNHGKHMQWCQGNWRAREHCSRSGGNKVLWRVFSFSSRPFWNLGGRELQFWICNWPACFVWFVAVLETVSAFLSALQNASRCKTNQLRWKFQISRLWKSVVLLKGDHEKFCCAICLAEKKTVFLTVLFNA